MKLDAVKANLEKRGYAAGVFATAADAAKHIAGALKNEVVGFGGSTTLEKLGVYDLLKANNTVIWHWKEPNEAGRERYGEFTAYLTSVNAVAESGELVNIDGAGNRVAATLYGPKVLYLVVGRNKITPDLVAAIHRARNVAAPANARRLNRKTPCVATGRCHDCDSPERICKGMVVHMRPMSSMKRVEVVLVDEDLGY